MNVTNIHQREIPTSHTELAKQLMTLASREDQVWPTSKWPRMKFPQGFEKGATGGHGPIRYTLTEVDYPKRIEFQFVRPKGFIGKHFLELQPLSENTTLLKHTIRMRTTLIGSIQWGIAIGPLHDALMEDCFDKVESQFSEQPHHTPWSWRVKLLRWLLK